MTLALIDWLIIGSFLATVIVIGLIVSRKGSRDAAAFFVGGRSMPWWLLGVSMVACTFSCDTPNLVTGMVRGGGVAANWGWWAFLITGMVTVFIYAQLWRRSKVMTDLDSTNCATAAKALPLSAVSAPCIWGSFLTV